MEAVEKDQHSWHIIKNYTGKDKYSYIGLDYNVVT